MTFFSGLGALTPIEVHSGAADFGIACLIGGACWALLRERREAASDLRAAAAVSGAAVVMAAGAATLKTSGMFLLPVLGAFVVFRLRSTLWELRRFVAGAVLLLAAASVLSFVITGCFVNNVAASCMDVPWGGD